MMKKFEDEIDQEVANFSYDDFSFDDDEDLFEN